MYMHPKLNTIIVITINKVQYCRNLWGQSGSIFVIYLPFAKLVHIKEKVGDLWLTVMELHNQAKEFRFALVYLRNCICSRLLILTSTF